MSQKPANSVKLPDVYKEAELKAMIDLIDAGVWRSTNLSKALHIDMNTVAEWKKRPEVQDAHRKAILKFARRRTDVEKILSELEFESDQEIGSLTQINNYFNLKDEQLDALINTKIRQIGAGIDAGGKAKADKGESAKVRPATPETTGSHQV